MDELRAFERMLFETDVLENSMVEVDAGGNEMIWMYCPKCGAPMRWVLTGWICTELGCGCIWKSVY